jgi:hypothetical protein
MQNSDTIGKEKAKIRALLMQNSEPIWQEEGEKLAQLQH